MSTKPKPQRILNKWFPVEPLQLWRFVWTMGGTVAVVLAASCSAEVSFGDGGHGGDGGAGGTVSCHAGACTLPIDDSTDHVAESSGGSKRLEAIAQIPQAPVIACTKDADCLSGFCTDGVCCDSRCDAPCMTCVAAKKKDGPDGVCGPVKYDTKPDADCPIGQACDGHGVCKKYTAAPCTSWAECLSNFCVDGFCCNNACNSECQACSAAKKSNGTQDGLCGSIKLGTDPDNECNPGACNGLGACDSPQQKLANGAVCVSANQCTSGNCTDGVCCDKACTGDLYACYACSAAKKGQGTDGTCGPIAYDTDPDEECPGGSCDGNGHCKLLNGMPCTKAWQCTSKYCVDGVCCGNVCMDRCEACTAAKKGHGVDGACQWITANTDPDNECNPGVCDASHQCDQPQPPPASNGTACVTAAQCASGACVDGVCCDSWCLGTCEACTAAIKGDGTPDGTCGPIKSETDTEGECYGGLCDGQGPCRFYNGIPCRNGGDCFSNYCIDGVCCGNICNGVCEACTNDKNGGQGDGNCRPVPVYTDPDNECPDIQQCNGMKACGLPDGAACSASSQCISGNCIDGVCCKTSCGGGATNDCMACNVAGSLGTCTPSPVGQTCRTAAPGGCDVPETCDGSSIACPADKYALSGVVCRAVNGDCDVAETCSGASPLCPQDGVKSSGTVCRGLAGTCDVVEVCNGIAKACPVDKYAAAGGVCRLATGPCDVAEVCTGVGPACPADLVAPNGTVCRASAGACDVAETCNGIAKICPPDGYRPSGTGCRQATDLCDATEVCTGSGPLCPVDGVKPVGTMCRDVAGLCDIAETCNGSAKACPTDVFALPTTECRPAAGVCDIAEKCTGSSAACPVVDTVKPSGTVCRPAGVNSTCDPAESCDGSNRDCPTNQFANAGTICGALSCSNGVTRNHMDVCDGAGVCFNGGTMNCPSGCYSGGATCSGGTAIQPVSGIWHNPARPGWSVHISRTIYDDVWLAWFTYRSDGSPIWYVSLTHEANGKFTTKPDDGLYTCKWDWANDQRVLELHGTISLTTASSTSGVLSWTLDGTTWQEPVQLYTFDTSGQAPYLTGGWYPPYEPLSKGPSPIVTVQGDSLLGAIATYETNGLPTWVYQSGTSTWNGLAFNASLEKRHGVNLCPGCAGPITLTSVPVGSMTLRNLFDSSGFGWPDWGSFDVSFVAASGLSTWNRSNLPISRLTF